MQAFINRYISLIILPIGCSIVASLLAFLHYYLHSLGNPFHYTLTYIVLFLGFAFISFYDKSVPLKAWLKTIILGLILVLVFYLNQFHYNDWATLMPFVISAYLVITWQSNPQYLWRPCQWLTFSFIFTIILWGIVLLTGYLLQPITNWPVSQLLNPYFGYPVTGFLLGISLAVLREQMATIRRFITLVCRFFLPVTALLVVITLITSLFSQQPRLSPMLLNLVMVILLASTNGSLNRQRQLPYPTSINKALKGIIWLSNILPLLALYSISLRFHTPQAYLLGIEGWLVILYSLVILIYSILYSITLTLPREINLYKTHYYLSLTVILLTLVSSFL